MNKEKNWAKLNLIRIQCGGVLIAHEQDLENERVSDGNIFLHDNWLKSTQFNLFCIEERERENCEKDEGFS